MRRAKDLVVKLVQGSECCVVCRMLDPAVEAHNHPWQGCPKLEEGFGNWPAAKIVEASTMSKRIKWAKGSCCFGCRAPWDPTVHGFCRDEEGCKMYEKVVGPAIGCMLLVDWESIEGCPSPWSDRERFGVWAMKPLEGAGGWVRAHLVLEAALSRMFGASGVTM